MPGQDPITRLNAALEGRYRIESELGEGGMATVYLADDLKHERKVALKVLKPELAAVVGAERFLAEIKTTANLHHPNILPLFDSGDADGFIFYVMPYLEGETLRDRIERSRQLPVEEAVGVVTSVANALQHAHERGIIHRDIKPGNILLQDGQPLVADFGIALAVGAGGGRLTETGLSVGTPYYMSPEQATGDQEVGPTSDIYSLAAVLFETLTGDPPYIGSTAQAVLGKIIQGQTVSATSIRRGVPEHVDAALRKALEKLPADRFADARGFAKALGDEGFRHGATGAGAAAAGSGVGRWRAAALTLGTALVASLAWSLLPLGTPPAVSRWALSTDGWVGLDRPVGRVAALAPDGSSMILPVVVDGELGLGLKLRDSPDVVPIPGTEGARDAVYSPGSDWIVFAVGTELKKHPLIGGSAITLAEDVESGNRVALDWLDDGTIVYEREGSGTREIVRIPEAGGDPMQTVLPPSNVAPIFARGLPGGRGLLMIDCEGNAVACQAPRTRLHVIDLEDFSQRQLGEQVIAAWYLDTGHIVSVRPDGAVFATAFDLSSLQSSGGAIPLFEGVRVGANFADIRVSPDGSLLYVEGESFTAGGSEVVWVDRIGREEPISDDLRGDIVDVSLSPLDDRLAVTFNDGADQDVWVKRLPDGPMPRVTSDFALDRSPAWMPDGVRIVYASNADGMRGLRSRRADGSGTHEVLAEEEVRTLDDVEFAPGSGGFTFRESGGGRAPDIGWVHATTGERRMVLGTEAAESAPTVSPDGRWIAYTSDVTGRFEVYVLPFADPEGARELVSTSGGIQPVWAQNGRELFYLDQTSGLMTVATYEADGDFRTLERRPLFDASRYASAVTRSLYDVTRDDQRFVMIRNSLASSGEQSRLIIVENWLEEVRERLR